MLACYNGYIMGEPGETNQHQNSTPDEIRRKVAAHQVYRREARRRRGYLRAALLLVALALAAPVLIQHGHGPAHGCRSWLTHAHRGHRHRHARQG